MLVNEGNRSFDLLGDPHLGRPFIHGVPLNRRGDRELMVWKQFTQSINDTSADYHVCMGDLFDKWTVSYELILRTANAYIKAAENHPSTTFVILKGNHDWIKDLERKSAFDVFAELVVGVSNIFVMKAARKLEDFLFVPWDPERDTTEVVSEFTNVTAAFGHWDIEYGDTNMVPTKSGIPTLYTGHDHKPRELTRDGAHVVVVGSMQPYAHGQEINDDLYVTLDADDVEDAGDLTNKCVRIIGDYPHPIDCLQLILKREETENSDANSTVTLGDFDMDTLFKEAFAEADVPSAITEKLLEQYHQRRVANGS